MKDMPRREFLSGSLTGAVALGTLGRAATRRAHASPSEKVAVAIIGVNGMGSFHVRTLVKRSDAVVACLCDVDEKVLAKAAQTVKEATGKTPKQVREYEAILDDPGVDAVAIATPHHWHGPIALRTLKAKKDVYLEKPATHVFREGRLLVEAARKYDRIFQHGTQMRTNQVTADAGKVLESGIIGEVRMSKAWNVQSRGMPTPVSDCDPPAGVDYDRWLGPAPKRPFNPKRFHKTWRMFRDYGNGDIGDDGAHDLDMARWGLGVTTHPNRITAHGSTILLKGYREFPDNMMVAYHYDEGKVLLYEDRLWTPYGMHGFDSGNAFYGTKGHMIFSRRGHYQVYLGKARKKGPGTKGKGLAGSARDHMDNFLKCVRTRKPTNATAETAHLSCALIHLGEIAFRTQTVLEFDPKREKITNRPEGNRMLTKQYRAPYGLPKEM